MNLDDLRKEYMFAGLSEDDIDPSPFKQFAKWFQEVVAAEIELANAMTLATATKDAMPSARVVLLKDFDDRGFVFYTDYESQKGEELASNPNAALVFYWREFGWQVRISGKVSKVSAAESDQYFQSRPLESRIAAWASNQSQVVFSRKALGNRYKNLAVKYQSGDVPRPPNWGGFRLSPEEVEFWQGRPNRLHDRLRYVRQSDGSWKVERLAP